ncbi:apolipoprotein C-II [Aquarana catesbeiana]|uniref:apolipoprotein C-II n=1 Tax=Aquarana catesbeiana TaxID=8400 RepID=UPI003CCA3B2B
MRLTQVVAISLLVVLLSSGIESYRVHKREAEEEPGILEKAQGYFQSAFGSISSVAEGVYDKLKETGVPDKIMEIYDQTTKKVTIYYGVLADQVYHLAGSQ